jgi:nucleoid DNA-binding protein
MKKSALTQKLARRAHVAPAEAADALDNVVHDVLRRLRAGNSVTWPGLGTFSPEGKNIEFIAEKRAKRRRV